MNPDLIVVGAGPGGATAAAVAAGEGARVLLLDKAAFPRDKVCGDAISGKSVDVLRELHLLDRVAVAESVDSWGVVFTSPSGDEVAVPFGGAAADDSPPGFVCARSVFDELVVHCAADRGAEILQEAAVEALLQEEGRVVGVRYRRGGEAHEARAPIVVGADGAYSVVARELGMTQLDERHYYAGVRAYYEGVSGFRDGRFIELHFIDEAIPGYFWIFPMADGRANVGLGTLSSRIKKHGIRLKPLLDEIVAHPRFRDRFEGARRVGRVRGWGMPLGSAPRTMAGNGWMLVGDAASLIDPFTGEGIGNAMVSGSLAARHALEALQARDPSAAALSSYEAAVHGTLSDELRLSYTLRRLESWRWLLNTVIRKAGRTPEVAETISSMFDDLSARKKLASPLFYLRVLTA